MERVPFPMLSGQARLPLWAVLALLLLTSLSPIQVLPIFSKMILSFAALEFEPLHMLGNTSTTQLHAQVTLSDLVPSSPSYHC